MLRARLTGLVTSGPERTGAVVKIEVAAPTEEGEGVRMFLTAVEPEAQQVLSTLRKGDGVCAEGAIKQFTEMQAKGAIRSFWLLEVDWLGEINRVFDPKRLHQTA